ncbi:hypothetical protein CkaCkLH20_07273 [Colletotrichum karsti]|uniref:Uncharacterized protein n=1 Tax=Colletotrichum karsti TaxID=1095194 RepID=A0A9P6I1A3_9PEZI|nr:uncharacterized protein CkaCkLH20_07273 [Colletotrichum karsti]KAF9875453.1 hypothetical protein CkaCkLH20_07273 [Colletotrichum karsti]
MYSSRYSIGGLRTVSHESPSYSQETRSISRQFSSQDDTPRAPPRTASHHTRSFSNSYSFDRSNDAFFNDRSNGSRNIARRMSESLSRDNLKDISHGDISHSKSCDICTDNTPCDICNQNSKAVDQNAGIDISGSYSRNFPSYSLWGDASHRTSNDASRDVNSHDATCKICSDSASDSSRHATHDISKKTSNEGFRGFPRSEYDDWDRPSPTRLNTAPQQSTSTTMEAITIRSAMDLPASLIHQPGRRVVHLRRSMDMVVLWKGMIPPKLTYPITQLARGTTLTAVEGTMATTVTSLSLIRPHVPDSQIFEAEASPAIRILITRRAKNRLFQEHLRKARPLDLPEKHFPEKCLRKANLPKVNLLKDYLPKDYLPRDYLPEDHRFKGPGRSNSLQSPVHPLSSNGNTDEPPSEHPRVPKPITRHGWRRYIHFSGWLIHIPAIILTAVLLWFASRERFWYRLEGPRRVNLTPKGVEVLLLVLLKIWEILVVLSLSAMAISMLRRRLIGGGVRLGFLTGGYRVGDFRYLFSLPFWRHGMFSLAFWELMMALFFILATLITIILLPAAGALLLPSLQWFPMDHTRAFGNVSTPLLYQTQPTQVWPTLFTDSAPWNNTRGCTEVEGIYNAACPAGGFTEIWNWAGGFATTGLSNQVTFSDSSTNLRRQLMITEITDSSVQDPPILSTTPSHHLNINFGLVKSYIDNGNGNDNGGDMNGDYPYRLNTRRIDSADPSNLQASNPIFQPFVQSKCYVAPKAEILANNGSLNYPVSSLNCFGDTACLQAQRASPPRAINASQWDTPECQGQLITTNVFAYQNGTPILQIAGQLPDPGGDHTQDRLFACNFLASWVAATVSTDSSECDALVSGLNNPDTMLSTFQKQSFGAPTEGYVMKFDSSWFQYLSPVSFASSVMVNGSKALKYYSATESFVRHFAVAEESRNGTATSRYSAVNNSTIGSAQAETFLSKVFGVYLTDAISRTGSESSTLVRSGSAAQVVVGVNAQYSKDDGPLVNETSDSATESSVSARQAPEDIVSDSMGFDFSVERYGWGTGKPSRALDFGKAVLYIYFAVLILYLLTVLFGILLELMGRWPSMHVLSVVPWWDLQELFVLALKTSPPRDGDLADAGAGVTSSHVWRKRVRAMAGAHHNVELVLNDGTVRGELSKTGKQKYF